MQQHHLTEQYQAQVAALRTAYPSAHRFLSKLENEGPAIGLWLSTATNAHLYKQSAFLMYIKLNNPRLRANALVLSPEFHQRIHEHTTVQSRLLFPNPIRDLIMSQSGFREKWAQKLDQGEYELRPNAPDTFFDALFALLGQLTIEPPL